MTDKSKPPSFEDIMKAASRPPEPERKEPKKPAPPPPEAAKRKPSAPTFAEIIGSVELRPEDRAPRPPPARRPRKEERKMPVVVRRPSLGKREESAHKPPKLRLGQKVQARVAHVGSEIGYLDLGGKGEAIIDLRELRNDKGELLVQPGGTLDAYVLSLADGTPVLTRAVPKGAGREVLQQALESKVPVEGTVTAQNKGGLEVDLGGLRAFVPASQIDVRFVEDTAP